EIVPCTFQFDTEATKILIPGLFEFSRATFPGFQMLPNTDKWLLIRNYQKVFQGIDSELRTLRSFGKGSNNLFGSYTTYIKGDHVDYFFSDCPDTRVIDIIRTMHRWLEDNVPKMKKQIHRIDPSEEELLAMIGIALWSVENLEASDELLTLAARYRTEIMAELVAHYRQTIGQERGASRLGVLLCLLQEFRRVITSMHPVYEIYRILDIFDDDSILYK
ncbi:hypothetical protein PENTCL1PPCAC_14912, partial [Pristionchus entomophagus]